MNIVEKAQKFEVLAQCEQTECIQELAKELHAMKPADRIAVMRQMTQDKLAHSQCRVPSGECVPNVEFDEKTGELKSLTIDYDPLVSAKYKFDGVGNLVAEDMQFQSDGHEESWKFAPKTGDPISEDVISKDGTVKHYAFPKAPYDGKLTALHTEDGKGFEENKEYDPITGKLVKQATIFSIAGITSTIVDQYDRVTGKQISRDRQLADGGTEHWTWTYNTRGHAETKTGDVHHKNGTWVHHEIKFDQFGFNPRSDHVTHQDGTVEDCTIDSISGQVDYKEVTLPDGTVKHYKMDPKSRELKETTT